MRRLTIPVYLTVQGPVITKSSAIGELGVDALMATGSFADPQMGNIEKRYYVPGTLIKGILREAWQELAAADGKFGEWLEWLGKESPKDSDDAPERGRLRFSDFADWETEPAASDRQRYRIQIDEDSGAVKGGQFQVMESPYAPGQEIRLAGEVRVIMSSGENETALLAAIQHGLSWAQAVGGTRTAGFGQILKAALGLTVGETLPAATNAGTGWHVRMTFQQPVIFSLRRIAGNLFESGMVIPGAALKGAVAEMMRREPGLFRELANELHGVRFTHAFPALKGGTRPRHWPLSLLAFAKDDKTHEFADVIRCERPFTRVALAGAFDIDWKESQEWKEVLKSYGWEKIKTELRVRTAIEGERQKARDEALFAWEMLAPHEHEWIAEVAAEGLTAAARQQLEQLLHFGIEPLGKTKARAKVTLEPKTAAAVPSAASYAVTLQTPALLINPGGHLAPNGAIGSASANLLRLEYEAVWKELSDGSLALANYFQRVSLAGGDYMRKRFRQPSPYRPYLLTDAGSTFLLKPVAGREKKAHDSMTAWVEKGLGLRTRVKQFYGINDVPGEKLWAHCPYLPENGYGEVTVNQESRYPEAPECTTND
ncbi:MAG: RAMP superfamily CRISPR-associated protein [Planctomycetota bacterium]